MEAARFSSDLDCSINLPSTVGVNVTGPPIPPVEGQRLVDYPASQPLTFDGAVQDVVLVEQEDKATQTEDLGKGITLI